MKERCRSLLSGDQKYGTGEKNEAASGEAQTGMEERLFTKWMVTASSLTEFKQHLDDSASHKV